MALTNILIGIVIFLLINILGVFHPIDRKIEYGEDIIKLRKLSDSLVRGPIITKTETKKGYGTRPETGRPKPKPRPYIKRG